MSILDFIQQKFYISRLLKKHRLANTNKAFISLIKAKSVGIICDFRTQTNQAIALNFYKQIHKDAVNYKVLLFISEKREEINLYDYEKLFKGADVYVVCVDDYNLYKAPKPQSYLRFVEQQFDICFRLELEPKFELDVVLLSSQSKMYAGAQNQSVPYLDFGIELSLNAGLNGLTVNLIEYLNSLNGKKKSTASDSSQVKDNTIF